MLICFKNISYEEVLNEWLNMKKEFIKTSTYHKYIFLINTYIFPFYKNKNFKSINNSDIKSFFETNSIIKLSNSTKNLIFSIIYSSINFGISKGYHKRMNINYLSFKEKINTIDYLTINEQKILEKHIKENINIRNLLILTALYSGTRLGEICSLKGTDIDFVNNTISIERTVQRIKNTDNSITKTKLIVDRPKTESSIRTIPIPKFIIVLLKKYMKDRNNYIFTNSKTPKDPRSVEKYFNSLLKRLNIRHVKFHALRHTFATRLREQKVDIKVVSELLGHSDWKITQDIYVHVSFEYKKKSIRALAKNWNKKSS